MPRRRNHRASSPVPPPKPVPVVRVKPTPKSRWWKSLKEFWGALSFSDIFVIFIIFVVPLLDLIWHLIQKHFHPHAW